MRLYEFKSALNELNTEDQLSPEDRNFKRTRFTPQELEFILELVKDSKLSQSELNGIVNDALVDYSRNKNSLRLAAPRMYALVHGELPLDKIDAAGWFSTIPDTMIRYAESKGYDVDDNLRRAEIDNEERRKEKAAKRSREDAVAEMVSFWKNHERYLHKPSVLKAREDIIKALMSGQAADIAFGPYFKAEPELESLHSRIQECVRQRAILREGMTKDDFFEIGDMLQDALNKYSAAKRGLGIANKLQDPADRAVHRSRIMGNMNRLRALVRRIEQKL